MPWLEGILEVEVDVKEAWQKEEGRDRSRSLEGEPAEGGQAKRPVATKKTERDRVRILTVQPGMVATLRRLSSFLY